MTKAEAGRRGGIARRTRMTRGELSEAARKAVAARYAKATPAERSEAARRAANIRHHGNAGGPASDPL